MIWVSQRNTTTMKHRIVRYLPLILGTGVALVVIAISYVPFTQAERLESDSYVIQFGNFNITSGEKSSASYTVTDTVGQTAAGPYGAYGSSGYVVGGGFQYIYPFSQFSFTISQLDIDLGTLTPDSHNTDTNTLTVTAPGASGYQVYAYEDHPLQTLSGANQIADTTCDSGTCTESTAQVWTNQSIPGFGFTATGDDVASDFINTSYFRQFADAASVEPMELIMSRSTSGKNRAATITYKAGITGNQAAGVYQTAIKYIAVPAY